MKSILFHLTGGLLLGGLSACGTQVPMGIVGPEGGSVAMSDGIGITVPPGALDRDVTIRIARSERLREGMLGRGYLFEPEGLKFLKPATVTLPFQHPKDLPADVEEPVFVYRAPANSPTFTNLGGQIIAPGLIQAETMGFSVFIPGTSSPTTIAGGQGYPQGLAVDQAAGYIYWAAYGTSSAPASGDTGYIMRATIGIPSTNSVGPAEVFATGQMDPKQIATDATYVYWTNGGSGPAAGDAGIMRLAKSGGTPTRIVTASFPVAIAVNASFVFWLDYDQGTVNRAGLDGTSPTVLAATGAQPASLRVDATNVYWVTRTGQVGKVPILGGTASIYTAGESSPSDLAVDSTYVYWADRGNGLVRRVPIKGGAVTTLRTLTRPTAIAVDSTYYFVNDAATGRIYRYPLKGGAGVVRSSTEGSVARIILDGSNIFWTTEGATKYDGQVKAITKL
jgi:hypothetical protein